MAKLGARRVTDLELTVPPAGGWLTTCHLDSGAPPAAGAATLIVGDLQLVGRILPGRGGTDSPDRPAVVVAGGYGWRTPLPAPGGSFGSPSQVRLSTVLRALVAIAGESYDPPPEALLGAAYGWDASTPGRVIRCRAVLADLVARRAIPMWRVDPATGRTVFTPWPTLPLADAHGVVDDRELARGVLHVKLSSEAAAWLPGARVTIPGPAPRIFTVARTVYTEHDGELTAKVWE